MSATFERSLFAQHARGVRDELERVRDIAAVEAAFSTIATRLPKIGAQGMCYLLAALNDRVVDDTLPERSMAEAENQAIYECAQAMLSRVTQVRATGAAAC